MKKYYILIFVIFLFSFSFNVSADTILETTDSSDNYNTIERNSVIIGATKFTSDEVITASKATTAGSNDALVYSKYNDNFDDYISPDIYVYYGEVGGWYRIDKDNNAFYIDDKEMLEQLSALKIYYVNNVNKKIDFYYSNYENVALSFNYYPDGVEFYGYKLLVDSDLVEFSLYDVNSKELTFRYDDNINDYVLDNSYCFDVKGGYIQNYDISCSKNVVIPSEINGKKIYGITNQAFANLDIKRIEIPETISFFDDGVFQNDNLDEVIIYGKVDETDFEYLPNDVFNDCDNIKYVNKLTDTLNNIPNEILLNISNKLDLDVMFSEIKKEDRYEAFLTEFKFYYYNYFLEDYFSDYMLGNSDDDRFICYTDLCYDIEYSSDSYDYVTVTLFDNKKRKFSKKIPFVVKEIVNDDKYAEIERILKNETVDKYIYKYTNSSLFTSYVSQQLKIKYGLEFLVGNRGQSGFIDLNDKRERIEYFSGGSFNYVFYDNVLYNYVTMSDNGVMSYFSSVKYIDSSSIDKILSSFSKYTGITNYKIKYIDGKKYITIMSPDYDFKIYYMSVLDADNNREWEIYFTE